MRDIIKLWRCSRSGCVEPFNRSLRLVTEKQISRIGYAQTTSGAQGEILGFLNGNKIAMHANINPNR